MSTTKCAVGKIVVTSATSVTFYMDYDASNGISFTNCGTVSDANPTAALGVAIYHIHTTVSALARNVDIDYARVWQDDSAVSVDESGSVTANADPGALAVGDTSSVIDTSQTTQILAGSSFEEGDLLGINGVGEAVLTTQAYDPALIGAAAGSSIDSLDLNGVKIVKTGKGPVKVSTENGDIAPGDQRLIDSEIDRILHEADRSRSECISSSQNDIR